MGIVVAPPTATVEQSDPLALVESIAHAGRKIGVARTASGTLVLVRERMTADRDSDGKPDKSLPKVAVWKRTSDLADIAAAIAGGLLDLSAL